MMGGGGGIIRGRGQPSTKAIAATVCLVLYTFLSQCDANTPAAGDDEQAGAVSSNLLDIRPVNYSQWNRNVTYISTAAFNARGMAPLYNITNTVINLFVDDDEPIPKGYIVVENKRFDLGPSAKNHELGDLLKKYWALLLLIFVITITAALMPLIGLCFCCCRCAGACGGRTQPFDKRGDTCRRFFYGLFLIIVASAMIFGVFVAFMTNSYLQHGVENATTVARYGINDTTNYLHTASHQLKHLLVDNYDELKTDLEDILNKTGNVVLNKLDEESKAIQLVNLNKFVQSLPEIKADLQEMKDETKKLRNKAGQLSDGLRGVKRELLTQLSKCDTADCKKLQDKYKIGQLDTNGIDYNQLPDVTEIIQGVDDLLNSKLTESIANSEGQLENVKSEVQRIINENIPYVEQALNETGRTLRRVSDEITNSIDKFSAQTTNLAYPNLKVADDYIFKYSIYRYYAGLILASVLLLVLLCIIFGLMCGICGKRPDGYGDDCCNKGAGGRFLMCSVAVIFLTVSCIMVITLALFLIGIVAKRGVCDPLKNPEGDQLFAEYFDQIIDLYDLLPQKVSKNSRPRPTAKSSEPLKLSEVISACHKNKTIYEVLHLETYYDINRITKLPEEYNIDQRIQQFVEKITLNDVTLLYPETKENIQTLAQSNLNSFEYYKFFDNLTTNITLYNLTSLADQLDQTARKITGANMNDIRISLLNQALHLRSYQKELVDPMIRSTHNMLAKSERLDRNLKNGKNNFNEAVTEMLNDIQTAETFLNGEGKDFVRAVASEMLVNFKNHFTTYLDMVVVATQNNIGRCGPISNVYNATITGACSSVVDPFNGFWTGVAFCLLLFFPTIILAVKLSTLYQKTDPYPGPLVEAEYLYDAYSERDNIPLANSVPKNHKRNKKRTSRRRDDYYEDASPSTGPHHHPRDARYNDMAPKNWDGAPPRYANPPVAPSAEYERPPPYYYPGAASDHD